ncbi:hypothetical protein [Roseateles sp.]|uniref:hypothetical protein n=1 Tax=Roseateles sp. TaxID=1971397 RepID=UPI0031E4903F
MTTPQERFRTLACFNELLDLACVDSELPEALRAGAWALRGSFPDGSGLSALVESGRQGLPTETAEVLLAGDKWLFELGRCELLSNELRRWWVWMDRHFPTRRDIQDQVEAANHPRSTLRPGIDSWIQP